MNTWFPAGTTGEGLGGAALMEEVCCRGQALRMKCLTTYFQFILCFTFEVEDVSFQLPTLAARRHLRLCVPSTKDSASGTVSWNKLCYKSPWSWCFYHSNRKVTSEVLRTRGTLISPAGVLTLTPGLAFPDGAWQGPCKASALITLCGTGRHSASMVYTSTQALLSPQRTATV